MPTCAYAALADQPLSSGMRVVDQLPRFVTEICTCVCVCVCVCVWGGECVRVCGGGGEWVCVWGVVSVRGRTFCTIYRFSLY